MPDSDTPDQARAVVLEALERSGLDEDYLAVAGYRHTTPERPMPDTMPDPGPSAGPDDQAADHYRAGWQAAVQAVHQGKLAGLGAVPSGAPRITLPGGLTIDCDLEPDAVIVDALVLARVQRPDGPTTFWQDWTEHTDGIVIAGLAQCHARTYPTVSDR